MSELQTATLLSPTQEAYIDFVASGGLSIPEGANEKPTTMSADEFAKTINVNRVTLYKWRKQIPDFWELVKERRDGLFAETRMTKIYNAMFTQAIKGNVQAASLLMKQASLLKADKVENKNEQIGELVIRVGE